MNARSSTQWFFLSFALIASVTVAAPVPLLKVADLVDKSDVIAMGRVTFIADAGPAAIETSNGTITGRTMAGEMRIDQVLKGPPELDTVRFQFKLPEVGMGYRGVPSGGYRILFLKSVDGRYEVASPYHPSVIALAGARITSERTVDKVFEAVATVLRSRVSSAADKREAINVLWGAPNGPAIAGLRSALSERDQSLQLNAAAALLTVNDVTALPMAVEALLNPEHVSSDVVLNLRGAISRGVTAQEAVPHLVHLAGSKAAETRRSAVAALGHTKSTSALVHLGRALDDDDFEVRLAAARALAEATGDIEMTPSMDAFRTDELRFVRYWKDRLSRR